MGIVIFRKKNNNKQLSLIQNQHIHKENSIYQLLIFLITKKKWAPN